MKDILYWLMFATEIIFLFVSIVIAIKIFKD